MVVPRALALRGAIGQFTLRRAATQARTNAWRQIGRRTYASDHGASKGSDVPWLIGSIVFTVPAAWWLYQQGPTPSAHGHDSHGHAEKHEEAHEEEPEAEEKAEEPEEESDSKSEEKEAPKEEEKSDESSSEDGEKEDTPESSDDEENPEEEEKEEKKDDKKAEKSKKE